MDDDGPWLRVSSGDDVGAALLRELANEVGPGHELHGISAEPLAKCGGCDDAVFRLEDGTWALVHLTWSGQAEQPPWPHTTRLPSFVALEIVMDQHEH